MRHDGSADRLSAFFDYAGNYAPAFDENALEDSYF
jgi:hypothetical protein